MQLAQGRPNSQHWPCTVFLQADGLPCSFRPSFCCLQVVPARASPHLVHPHRCSGLMLANHTAVRHTLDKTVSQFDTLFQRRVMLRGPPPHLCPMLCRARLSAGACATAAI